MSPAEPVELGTVKVKPCREHKGEPNGCWVGRCVACQQKIHKPVGRGGRPPRTCSDRCRQTVHRGQHLLFSTVEVAAAAVSIATEHERAAASVQAALNGVTEPVTEPSTLAVTEPDPAGYEPGEGPVKVCPVHGWVHRKDRRCEDHWEALPEPERCPVHGWAHRWKPCHLVP